MTNNNDNEDILTEKLKDEYKRRVNELTNLKKEVKDAENKIREEERFNKIDAEFIVKTTMDALDAAGMLPKEDEVVEEEPKEDTSFELSARILKVHKNEDDSKYSYNIGLDLDSSEVSSSDPRYIYYRSMDIGETKPIEELYEEGDILNIKVDCANGYTTPEGYHIRVINPHTLGESDSRTTSNLNDIRLMSLNQFTEVDDIDEIDNPEIDSIPDSTMESFMNVKDKWMPFTLTQHYTGKDFHYDLRFDTGRTCECFRTKDNNQLRFNANFKLGVDRRQPLKRLSLNSYIKEGPLKGVNIIVASGKYRVHDIESNSLVLQMKANPTEVDKYPIFGMKNDKSSMFKLALQPPELTHKLRGYWKIKNVGQLKMIKVNDESSNKYQDEWLKRLSNSCLYTPQQLKMLDDEFSRQSFYVNTIAKKFQLNRKTVYKYCELLGR